MTRKCYKFKLYNSKKNKKIHKLIDLSGEIYNHSLALHKRYYRLYKTHLKLTQLQKHITKIKNKYKKHWFNLPSQSIQQITERIENAYKRFYDYVKAKQKGLKSSKVSLPNFKKGKKYKSFTLKQSACKLENNTIIINGRKYKYFNSRNIEGKINTVTVKRDAIGDLYICISVEATLNSKYSMTGKSAGLDFGLRQFLTSSDDLHNGSDLAMPQNFKKALKKLKKNQQRLSKKAKNSKNRNRARLKVAKLHKEIVNQREYHHHKIANRLVASYDILHLETLNIKAMQMLWGRKVSDYGFANFKQILEYKAASNNKIINYIDRWYPSSKTCSQCLEINHALKLRDREWACPSCQAHHHRDKNAAVNIHRVGMSTLGLGSVRPESNQAVSA